LPCLSNADGELKVISRKEEQMNRLVLLAGLIITLVGCTNRSTPPPATPTIDPPTQAAPTPTSIPPTATPVEIPIQVTAELANCRFGPGTVYQPMNEIRGGRLLNAVGRDVSSNWWQVEDPINPGGYCWVAAEVTEIEGVRWIRLFRVEKGVK